VKISRNAPCPCGSGQKYKKCCLPKEESQDFSYRRISQTFQSLTGKLMTFAQNTLEAEGMDEAIDTFLLWGEELDHEDTIDELSQVMVPWILCSWDLTQPDIEELDFEIAIPADTTIAELYRQKRSSKIDSLELHVLESVGRLVFSFYEVTAVFPGNGFACIDILTGSSHRVTDHSASEWLAQGSILFCAISRVDDVEFLSAASPISFPLPWKTHVIDLRTSLIGQKNALSTEDLADYEFEIREVFLELYAAAINPPSLSNTDGDPLSLQTLHYRISSPKDAFDALVHLCVTESPEQLLENADYTESGELAGVTIPWSRLEAAKTTPMSNTILGYIDIERESMTVEVNSDKRAAEIREIIQNAIGDKAHYKTTSIKPVRTPGERAEDDDDPLGCHNKMMQDPAVREHMENMFLDHWGQWVDTPLPILDGQTPREAAKSPSGREKVDALIRSAFLNSERSPDLEVQKKGIDRARTELGL